MNVFSSGENAREYRYAVLGYILGAVALTIVLVILMSGFAVGQTAGEIANETVEVTNETEHLDLEIAWNDSVASGAGPVNLTVYELDDFDENGSSASVVLEDQLDPDEGNTTTEEYLVNETDLEGSEDYRAILDGDETLVEDYVIATDDAGGFPIFGGDNAGASFVGLLVVVALAAAFLRR